MKRLFLRFIFLIAPLLLLVMFFMAADPMRVLHTYDSPVIPGPLMNDRVFQFKHLSSDSNQYNAFIFGSSRSKSFKTWNWANHLPGSAMPFHMGVNDESLFGIEKKIIYLDKQGYNIENVLIILDNRILKLDKNNESHIYREHYVISSESKVEFYKKFFIAFLNPGFLKAYLSWLRNPVIEKEMTEYLWNPGFTYVNSTGDINYSRYDSILSKDSIFYYHKYKNEVFYSRDSTAGIQSGVLIEKMQVMQLEVIKRILNKHRSNYKIIITPNYDQIPVNSKDLKVIKDIFGAENVFNYSGINSITNDIGNYYEERHFKPYIANRILDEVYNLD